MATMCDDLSDVTVLGVSELIPAWLELVAARVCEPGARVRVVGRTIHVTTPERLLVTMFCDNAGVWGVRLQSLPRIEELGLAGRPFSIIGLISLDLPPGCASPARAADALCSLLDLRTSLAAVQEAPHPQLLSFWLERSKSVEHR